MRNVLTVLAIAAMIALAGCNGGACIDRDVQVPGGYDGKAIRVTLDGKNPASAPIGISPNPMLTVYADESLGTLDRVRVEAERPDGGKYVSDDAKDLRSGASAMLQNWTYTGPAGEVELSGLPQGAYTVKINAIGSKRWDGQKVAAKVR